jgi:Domain of unknown function (DUF4136)
MASATSSTIQNGTLVVDVYDPAAKQLIWSGQATKALNPSGNQEKDMQRLNKAMAKASQEFSSYAQELAKSQTRHRRKIGAPDD